MYKRDAGPPLSNYSCSSHQWKDYWVTWTHTKVVTQMSLLSEVILGLVACQLFEFQAYYFGTVTVVTFFITFF